MNKATRAVDPMPAAKLSTKTAIANNTTFLPTSAKATKRVLAKACNKPNKNKEQYKDRRMRTNQR